MRGQQPSNALGRHLLIFAHFFGQSILLALSCFLELFHATIKIRIDSPNRKVKLIEFSEEGSYVLVACEIGDFSQKTHLGFILSCGTELNLVENPKQLSKYV